MNLPNKLTMFRMLMVLPLIILFSIIVHYKNFVGQKLDFYNINVATILFIIVGFIFIIAMISDALDGYIARKRKITTNFGKLFDPIADKFVTTSTFVFFAVLQIVPAWVAVFFVVRNILVDGLRNLAAKKNFEVSAKFFGKFKTIWQTIAIVSLFFLYPLSQKYQIITNFEYHLINLNTYIALGLSFYSATIYVNKFRKLID